MKAIILAGGLGTRLYQLTKYIPKPMLPVQNVPVLERLVNLLKLHGITEIMINVMYRPEVIMEHFQNGAKWGVNISYALEKEQLGTAGSIKGVEDFIEGNKKPFLVLSGDALTNFDLGKIIRFHERKQAIATIALKEVEEVSKFGVVVTDDMGLIKGFQEKPEPHEAKSKVINTGIYVFSPEIFKHIPTKQFYDFGKNVFPSLVAAGLPFYGCPMGGYWRDIGSIDEYHLAQVDYTDTQNLQEDITLPNYSKKYIQGVNYKTILNIV
jgi:mannose-1-phosphate guanylyltransferase